MPVGVCRNALDFTAEAGCYRFEPWSLFSVSKLRFLRASRTRLLDAFFKKLQGPGTFARPRKV